MDVISLRVIRHTRNVGEMVQFYRDHLGMRVLENWDRPGSQGAVLAFEPELGGTTIELLNAGGQAKPDVTPVNLDLAIEVTEVDAWRDRLRAHGVPIVAELEDKPWGHRAFSVEDPDGLRVTFYKVIA